MREPTNFSAYSHSQLYAMLQRGDDTSVRPAADSWDSVGAALHEQAGNLEAKLAKFQDEWRGGASEQYRVMITDLSGGLRRIADAAFAIRDRVHDSADALAKARTDMPPAVEVADLPDETVRLATTSLEVDQATSPAAVAQLRQRQADAAQAVQKHQQASAAADAAHAKAIAVMTELGGKYRAADQGMPLADQTTVPDAPVPGDGAGDDGGDDGGHGGHGGTDGGAGEPEPGQQPEPKPGEKPHTPPLFGNMFTAGLAAASAAGMGRLGGFRPPKVPEWGKPKDPADEEKDDAKPIGMPRGAMPGLGGGSLGGGAGMPAPTAAAGLSGIASAPNAMGAAGVLGAAAGAVNAAGSGVGGMPMMPMMPFAPGGQDMSGARRIPPWLVETEEVWGESSVITPSVLGAEPPDQRSF
ncbi:PPE domain-containing protein [Saccharopolyspora sp. NPDC050389]|uniref:WXG100 family type VII secretion target n=1 Tax=Saccharopolyspora sp. NPDC050389 TaxID=3155516 RepID=UPI0034114AA7